MSRPVLTRVLWACVWGALLLSELGCQRNDSMKASPQTITDRILEDNQFSLLRTAVVYARAGDLLKSANLTLFAPNDAAFQASNLGSAGAITALPREQVYNILLYHVLYGSITSTDANIRPNGAETSVQTASRQLAYLVSPTSGQSTGLRINNATVTTADLSAANGTIHVIDRVLMPPTGSIQATLQNNSDLSFLLAAISRVAALMPDLAAIVNNDGTSTTRTVTFFAPTNAAFQAAGYRDLSAINNANVQTLGRILAYHVHQGLLFTWALKPATTTGSVSVNTILGINITSSILGNTVLVKGAKNAAPASIQRADVLVTNGVVHVIDQVLQP